MGHKQCPALDHSDFWFPSKLQIMLNSDSSGYCVHNEKKNKLRQTLRVPPFESKKFANACKGRTKVRYTCLEPENQTPEACSLKTTGPRMEDKK